MSLTFVLKHLTFNTPHPLTHTNNNNNNKKNNDFKHFNDESLNSYSHLISYLQVLLTWVRQFFMSARLSCLLSNCLVEGKNRVKKSRQIILIYSNENRRGPGKDGVLKWSFMACSVFHCLL